MAKLATLRPSFAGGEISPRLYGRADLARYGISAEAIENYIVRPEGGLMRRHGLRFAGETKDHSKRTRLVPFVFSTIQAYMLEFGNTYIRFWKDNAPITSASNSITAISKANPAVLTYSGADNYANGDRVIVTAVVGMGQVNNREFTVANLNAGANTFELSGVNSTAYDTYVSGGTVAKILEVVSPYADTDVEALFVTQSTDTLYLTHPSYLPRTLTRTSNTAWTLATVSQQKGPFAPRNIDPASHIIFTLGGGSTLAPGGLVTMRSNAGIFLAGHVGSVFYVEERYLSDNAVSPWAVDQNVGGLGTQVSSNGNVYEQTAIGAGVQTGQIAPAHTDGEAWDNPIHASNHYKRWRYLHSRWAIVEITAVSDAHTASATIRTRLPDGLNPATKTVTGAVAGGTTGYVQITSAAHGFSEGDYVYQFGIGGTTEANGDFKIVNVFTNTYELEGVPFVNAFSSNGSARRYPTWYWRFGAFSTARGFPAAVALHEQRLIFANTLAQPFGLWASRAGDYTNHLPGTNDDDALTYNIAGNQADPIRWLASSSDLILGTLAQEYAAYGGGLGDPITPTNTRIVPQSSEGSNAVQPVKAGGATLFCNRAGRKVFELRGSGGGDSSYGAMDLLEMAEHLTVGKTITRMAWAKNPASLLWALRSDGSLCSMTYRRDQEIWAWARHVITGTIESIAVIPSADGTTDQLWLSIARTINGGTKRYIEYLAPPFEPTSGTDKDAMGYVDSGLQYNNIAVPVSVVSGLWHLEGQTVKVVAGGAVHPDRTVSGGKITLDASYTNVWVGLAYTSRVRTVRIETPALGGTSQGKTKRIPRVTVRVHNAIGGKVGPSSETTMEDLVRRELNGPTDASPVMYSGDVDAYLATDYDTDGRLAIIQDEAMPLDILAFMPVENIADG